MNILNHIPVISKEEYIVLAERCYYLIKKGEDNLTPEEDNEFDEIVDKMSVYEDIFHPITEEEKEYAERLKIELQLA